MLEERANAATDATPWIQYGVALQRAGRPLSAEARSTAPSSSSPRTWRRRRAPPSLRFEKDDPSQAFSRLGPLSDRFGQEPVVRFHLGLCLLWLRQVEEARDQLEQAVAIGGETVWGRQAAQLLESLDSASG